MKRSLVISAVAVFLIVTCLVVAAEQAGNQPARGSAVQSNDPDGTARAPRVRTNPQIRRPVSYPAAPERESDARGREAMTPEARREMYNRIMAQRGGMTHQELIQELEAVKKIAEEENATKTVAALNALITRSNTEFQKQQADMRRRSEDARHQMQRRFDRLNRSAPGQGKTAETPQKNQSGAPETPAATLQND